MGIDLGLGMVERVSMWVVWSLPQLWSPASCDVEACMTCARDRVHHQHETWSWLLLDHHPFVLLVHTPSHERSLMAIVLHRLTSYRIIIARTRLMSRSSCYTTTATLDLSATARSSSFQGLAAQPCNRLLRPRFLDLSVGVSRPDTIHTQLDADSAGVS